jgi:hypothetical protein
MSKVDCTIADTHEYSCRSNNHNEKITHLSDVSSSLISHACPSSTMDRLPGGRLPTWQKQPWAFYMLKQYLLIILRYMGVIDVSNIYHF